MMKMSIHLDYKEVVSSFFRVNSFSKHCEAIGNS